MEVLTPSKRSVLKKNLPAWIAPTLSSIRAHPFSDPDWLFEKKLSGERCTIYKQEDDVRLMSGRKNITHFFPEIAAALRRQKGSFIVDGEIVALESGLPSFARLQARMNTASPSRAIVKNFPVYLYLFDMMHGGDYNITDLKLLTRKDILATLVDFEDPIRMSPYKTEEGVSYFNAACEEGWAGIIAKNMSSPYESGLTENWLEIPCQRCVKK